MGRGSQGHVAKPREPKWALACRGGDSWAIYTFIYIYIIIISISIPFMRTP